MAKAKEKRRTLVAPTHRLAEAMTFQSYMTNHILPSAPPAASAIAPYNITADLAEKAVKDVLEEEEKPKSKKRKAEAGDELEDAPQIKKLRVETAEDRSKQPKSGTFIDIVDDLEEVLGKATKLFATLEAEVKRRKKDLDKLKALARKEEAVIATLMPKRDAARAAMISELSRATEVESETLLDSVSADLVSGLNLDSGSSNGNDSMEGITNSFDDDPYDETGDPYNH